MTTRKALKENAYTITKKFGERMTVARELCGMSQIAAAELLGYENSSKLSKVEHCSDGTSIPFWLIPKAAEVYGVSADYLLGLSDHWQRNPEEVQQKQLESLLEHATKAQINTIREAYSRLSFLSEAVTAGNAKVGQIKATLARFAELNPEFEDMLCGARLVRLINEASHDANKLASSLSNYPS